ncbi:hypothetical protein Xhom_01204 [Xenorhabdus hominickii]|uniref:Uncharacterized protein n=1 Tax=Xenorhabdus hominickii TaxID=351679 RepID=A0A2G0QG46_XENHO|nr:hypothetical protein Xhom_01204 [Xenorhabdus hominickii]
MNPFWEQLGIFGNNYVYGLFVYLNLYFNLLGVKFIIVINQGIHSVRIAFHHFYFKIAAKMFNMKTGNGKNVEVIKCKYNKPPKLISRH